LRGLFGPSKQEIWQELARQLPGSYLERGWLKEEKVQASYGDWTVTLDTYNVSTNNGSATYTRLRAPFVNHNAFRFTIYRAGLFSELGKFFGNPDLEVGEPEFDRQFIVQGTHPQRVRALCLQPSIRELMLSQPEFFLTVKDDEGWFGTQFPQGVDELWFQVPGVIREVPRLRRLFDLFSEVLHHLGHFDAGYHDDVGMHIQALSAPGGTVHEEEVQLWEGNTPRCRAAVALGRLKDRRGVPALVRVVTAPDADPELVRLAFGALEEIADPAAASSLVPLLGNWDVEGRVDTMHRVERTLRTMGEGTRIEALRDLLLGGNAAAVEQLRGPLEQAYRQAMLRYLEHCAGTASVAPAAALGLLGAGEAVPVLRNALRRIPPAEKAARESVRAVIDSLERRAQLPVPGAAPEPRRDALPVPASAEPG
jgi:hypothetical protein